MNTYYINWLHIPTGKRGMCTHDFLTVQHLYEKLNNWNRQQPGTWVYYFYPGMDGFGGSNQDSHVRYYHALVKEGWV